MASSETAKEEFTLWHAVLLGASGIPFFFMLKSFLGLIAGYIVAALGFWLWTMLAVMGVLGCALAVSRSYWSARYGYVRSKRDAARAEAEKARAKSVAFAEESHRAALKKTQAHLAEWREYGALLKQDGDNRQLMMAMNSSLDALKKDDDIKAGHFAHEDIRAELDAVIAALEQKGQGESTAATRLRALIPSDGTAPLTGIEGVADVEVPAIVDDYQHQWATPLPISMACTMAALIGMTVLVYFVEAHMEAEAVAKAAAQAAKDACWRRNGDIGGVLAFCWNM